MYTHRKTERGRIRIFQNNDLLGTERIKELPGRMDHPSCFFHQDHCGSRIQSPLGQDQTVKLFHHRAPADRAVVTDRNLQDLIQRMTLEQAVIINFSDPPLLFCLLTECLIHGLYQLFLRTKMAVQR